MELIYNNTKIKCTKTYEQRPLKYRYEKLYFGIIIEDCFRYSSLYSLYNVDCFLTNKDGKVLKMRHNMKPNTYLECDGAYYAIITPVNYFDIEKDKYFQIK